MGVDEDPAPLRHAAETLLGDRLGREAFTAFQASAAGEGRMPAAGDGRTRRRCVPCSSAR